MERRNFLRSVGVAEAGSTTQAAAQSEISEAVPEYKIVSKYKASGKVGMPGLYPWRVIEVRSEASISETTDRVDRIEMKKMLDRGMTGLTGANTPA